MNVAMFWVKHHQMLCFNMLNQFIIMTFVFGDAEEKFEDIKSFPDTSLSLSLNLSNLLGGQMNSSPLLLVVFPGNM